MEDQLPPVMTATNVELQQFINKCANSAPTYVVVSINYSVLLNNNKKVMLF